MTRSRLSSLSALLIAAPVWAALPQQPAPDFSVFSSAHLGRTIPLAINNEHRLQLVGNVPAAAQHAELLGAVDPKLPMDRMILTLKMSPDAMARREQLLEAQQNPASPYYHKWLTAQQYGDLFGPSKADVDAVAAWLMGQGFSIDEIAPSRMTINFSGDAAKVQQAFRTSIQNISVDGQARQANVVDPSIPMDLANVVAGVVSLHNIPRQAMHKDMRKLSDEETAKVLGQRAQGGIQPQYSSGATHYTSANDFASIYNLNPLYTAAPTAINGTGQTIAIVGRCNIPPADPVSFRSSMALPANAPVIVVNGADPGVVSTDEQGEAELDVQWSGAVGRLATVKFVVSKSTSTTDGVDLSAQYIVNNGGLGGSLASATGVASMSTSFGSCESGMGTTENTFYNNLWAQAAAEGITAFVSAGDAGAAGCNGGGDTTGSGAAINGLASTPYNVCVGGTEFNDASYATYWNTSNGSGFGSAKGYIPEMAWNESTGTTDPSGTAGSGLWSTGGGVSTIYAKPSWQSGTGVPADGKRDCPDVSFTAASHDGYIVNISGTLYIIGGTSASSPAWAGMMALVAQKAGGPQGNANYSLYQLARAQNAGGAAIFHDVTVGNNTVPGVTGFSTGTGYDLSTGLGSVDGTALVNNWITPDSTAPTVTASETGGRGVVSFDASASDNVAVTQVLFFLDGVQYARKTAAPYSAGWNSAGHDGAHTLTAKAYDAAGNITTSSTVNFSTDSTAPAVSASETGTKGVVAFNATASDASGVSQVAFYLDGSLYSRDYAAPFTASWNSAAAADGGHTMYAIAYDAAGNAAASSTVNFTTANDAPAVSASETGDSGIVHFNATATDSGASVASVTFFLDGAVYGHVNAAPYTMAWSSAGHSGAHTLSAIATNSLGNSTASSTVNFNIN